MKAIITFDLENPTDYQKAYMILASVGLFPVSPTKGLDLPSTTVMGELEGISAEKLKDFVWDTFKKAGLKPSSIFGGILDDWALTTKR